MEVILSGLHSLKIDTIYSHSWLVNSFANHPSVHIIMNCCSPPARIWDLQSTGHTQTLFNLIFSSFWKMLNLCLSSCGIKYSEDNSFVFLYISQLLQTRICSVTADNNDYVPLQFNAPLAIGWQDWKFIQLEFSHKLISTVYAYCLNLVHLIKISLCLASSLIKVTFNVNCSYFYYWWMFTTY